MGWYDRKVRRVRDLSCGDTRIFLELEVRRIACRRCGKVKRERLDFLADNPLYTKRFAHYVGRRCRDATIKDVATELGLDWHTVKALEMQYMQAQLKRAGTPAPRAIGIDESSIRKGHTYRIVVSDLDRGRPIWFGGEDRSETSMGQFYGWLGARKSSRIGLDVMDMWKPFRLATAAHARQAAILFDKFHIRGASGSDAGESRLPGSSAALCAVIPPTRRRSPLGDAPQRRLHIIALRHDALAAGGKLAMYVSIASRGTRRRRPILTERRAPEESSS